MAGSLIPSFLIPSFLIPYFLIPYFLIPYFLIHGSRIRGSTNPWFPIFCDCERRFPRISAERFGEDRDRDIECVTLPGLGNIRELQHFIEPSVIVTSGTLNPFPII